MEMKESNKPLWAMERRVTMGDVDAARIIFFVAPMGWQEAAFTGWLHDSGYPLSSLIEAGQSCPTISVKTDFLVPLVLDDWVRLELWPNHLGNRSFSLRTDVYRTSDERLCVQMMTWHVWADMGNDVHDRVKAVALPAWLRQQFGETAHGDNGDEQVEQ
jgi:YbgC/YbaW family acyl-CoA thioester hydrolase